MDQYLHNRGWKRGIFYSSDNLLNFTVETLKPFWKITAVHLHRGRNISMSTIVNMFTEQRDWNDTLVRNFIRKWYFV